MLKRGGDECKRDESSVMYTPVPPEPHSAAFRDPLSKGSSVGRRPSPTPPKRGLTMKLLPKSRFLCERCTRMTSTLEGLRELASAEGYRHLTVVEVHKLAASGCPFCAILKNNHKRSPHPAAFIQLRLRFPVRRDGKAQFHSVPAVGTGHPFEIAKLDMLESVILDDSMNYLDLIEGRDHFQLSGFGRISTMYPFTGPGEIIFE